MNLYKIAVWGPCNTADDVRTRMKQAAEYTAFVCAPDRNTANDMCYLVSNMLHSKNKKRKGISYRPNYQLIDTLLDCPPFILHSPEFVLDFDDELLEEVKGLTTPDADLADSRHSSKSSSQTRKDLFSVEVYRYKKNMEAENEPCGSHWAYVSDKEAANAVTVSCLDGLLGIDPDEVPTHVLVHDIALPVVIWNPKILHFEMGTLGETT